MSKLKIGDTIIIKDKKMRDLAPKDRESAVIIGFSSQGWVAIRYKDGFNDFLMASQIHNHWTNNLGVGTKLWDVLNS